MKILVKFPTRSRPEKFLDTLKKYVGLSQCPKKIHYVITADSDDWSMVGNKDVETYIKSSSNISLIYGKSEGKIHAINRDMELLVGYWDILLLASDDMIPQKKGWDEIIRENMIQKYPDTDGALWFFDGHRRDLNTLVVMGKKYYDRFNYIYNPKYLSVYCDDEYTQVGLRLNKLFFIDEIIIKHDHPHFINEKFDFLMIRNESRAFYEHDRKILEDSIKNDFYLNEL